jgi:hypothetical protein
MRLVVIALFLALDGGSTWQPCDGSGTRDPVLLLPKVIGRDPGDRDIQGVILRRDGGWASEINPDGGRYWYVVPIAGPPSRPINAADAGPVVGVHDGRD